MIDWDKPIESDETNPRDLVAWERVSTGMYDCWMRWVQVIDGEEGWDGWYAKDDGTPQFTGISGGPNIRNKQ